MAGLWALRRMRDEYIFRARWQTAAGYNPGAGPQRNQRMLDAHPGVNVVAFVTPEARGTWDCVTRARKLDRNVTVIKEDGSWWLLTPNGLKEDLARTGTTHKSEGGERGV